ncbi:CDPK-related kinase 1, partial [Camellia lanceoleosa]
MTRTIAIEEVRRDAKILRALVGHKNLVQFYDAYEDDDNVYVVMKLCKGGELLDRILSRGGKYSEEDAKVVVVQILSVVAYCHLQGVVHRDLKPELKLGGILTLMRMSGQVAAAHSNNIQSSIQFPSMHNFPVCFEYLFETTKDITVLPCGHTIHLQCMKEMEQRFTEFAYSCPACSKSYCDMSQVWQSYLTPMPQLYKNKM